MSPLENASQNDTADPPQVSFLLSLEGCLYEKISDSILARLLKYVSTNWIKLATKDASSEDDDKKGFIWKGDAQGFL